eukprot:Opistho-1_new@59889
MGDHPVPPPRFRGDRTESVSGAKPHFAPPMPPRSPSVSVPRPPAKPQPTLPQSPSAASNSSPSGARRGPPPPPKAPTTPAASAAVVQAAAAAAAAPAPRPSVPNIQLNTNEPLSSEPVTLNADDRKDKEGTGAKILRIFKSKTPEAKKLQISGPTDFVHEVHV